MTKENKKPVSVIIISSLFIAAGLIGFVYHLSELNQQEPFAGGTIPVLLIRLAAVAGGIITLSGYGFGRCILIAWMLYHVILSIFHTLPELLLHSALLAVISFFLLRPKASDYFRQTKH